MRTILCSRVFRAALGGGLLCGAAPPAIAAGQGWQVTRLVGAAWTTTAQGMRSALAVGATLDGNATVVTGERSRAMLVRGADSMVIGPVSVVAMAERPDAALSTAVMQKAGSVTFDVEHRAAPHFEVETPMLAAVVKGTRFTVTVGRATGGVGVSRGAVQVTALATGQVSTVTVGQRASVDTRGMSVSGPGAAASAIRSVPPRASAVSPVSEVSPATVVSASEMAAVAGAASVMSAQLSASVGPAAAASSVTSHQAGTNNSDTVTRNTSPGGLIGAISAALGSRGGNPASFASPATPPSAATAPQATATRMSPSTPGPSPSPHTLPSRPAPPAAPAPQPPSPPSPLGASRPGPATVGPATGASTPTTSQAPSIAPGMSTPSLPSPPSPSTATISTGSPGSGVVAGVGTAASTGVAVSVSVSAGKGVSAGTSLSAGTGVSAGTSVTTGTGVSVATGSTVGSGISVSVQVGSSLGGLSVGGFSVGGRGSVSTTSRTH